MLPFYSVNILGILVCLDGYMNIALEGAQEYYHGLAKQSYGDVFIRGNNGMKCYSVKLIINIVLYIQSCND